MDVEHDEPVPGQRLALFVRADFAVRDWDQLRAAGVRRLMDCCGETVADPETAVPDAAAALTNLVGHDVHFEDLHESGLAPLAETVLVIPVDRGMFDRDADGGFTGLADDLKNPWAPLLQMMSDASNGPVPPSSKLFGRYG